jgi:hypothetical protein
VARGRQDLLGGIEQILQRKVVAFMSNNYFEPDMTIEAFVLASADHDGVQHSRALTCQTPSRLPPSCVIQSQSRKTRLRPLLTETLKKLAARH